MQTVGLRKCHEQKPCTDIDECKGQRNQHDGYQFNPWPVVAFLRTSRDVGQQGGDQHRQRLKGMKEVADDVVMVPTETVGSRFIFWTVRMLVVVADVGRKEDETWHTLNDGQKPIRQSIHEFGFPNTKVSVVVLDHA